MIDFQKEDLIKHWYDFLRDHSICINDPKYILGQTSLANSVK